MPQPEGQYDSLRIKRLVIVSNRLPIALDKGDGGEWQARPSPGGLVSALSPALRGKGGLWIGWPGTLENIDLYELSALRDSNTWYTLKAVTLSQEELDQYYLGFSNEVIWPLFHNLESRCKFAPAYWNVYQAVNRKFAQVIAENARKHDYIWVHDYHLMLVAKELHAIGVKTKVGFFLHTPFPPLDTYARLPWRSQVLGALLEYDLIGFQTLNDRHNFLQCVQALIMRVDVDARRQVSTINMPERRITVGAFPISIDFKEFARQAASKIVAENAKQLREAIPRRQIVLGVDRLDYSKGIPERLRAFADALERFDDLRGKVSLVQIVLPSREGIPEYQGLKGEIEGLVSEINGRFTQPGWIPIHYMYRNLQRSELLAYYRAADMALVTPLKDGMNLIAKEYCAANVDNNGILILSEFAGAARQLRGKSLLVNPYDIEGVANAIYRAFNMSTDERRLRMRRLRKSIAKRDIFWWVDSFLRAATTTEIHGSKA